MNEATFNLTDRPWVPCADLAGQHRILGFRDVLALAHELRELEHPNPLTVAALMRVLLAAVHRVVEGPKTQKEWIALYMAGRFPEDRIDAYFDRWRDRFDLFSPEAPFYQTPGLTLVNGNGAPAPVSVSTIMLERASGNNKTVFDHTTDEIPLNLTPAEAAHALVTAQMYSLGGLNKKTTKPFGFQQSYLNAVMVNGIFVALAGNTLFETLMLNLLIYTPDEPMPSRVDDAPVWERNELAGVAATTPRGYLDFLTCSCRHLRLVPEGDEMRVGRVHIAQGEAFPNIRNPAFISKQNKDGEWYHPQLDVERLVWRDSNALFAFDAGCDRRPAALRQVSAIPRAVVRRPARYLCNAIALANDKANPLAWRKETLSVPIALLEDGDLVPLLRKGMEYAEDGRQILDDAVKTFMRNALPPNSKDVNDKAAATGALRLYWDRLERHFHAFLASIEEGDAALAAWSGNIAATAREAFEMCVRQRYADSARTLKAWAAASDQLNARLAGLNVDKGGGKK